MNNSDYRLFNYINDWFKCSYKNTDGHVTNQYHEEKVFDIIKANRWNQNPIVYSCEECKSVNSLTGSYIAYVEEDEFINKTRANCNKK